MRTGNLIYQSSNSKLKIAAIAVSFALALPLSLRAGAPSESDLGRQALAEEFADAAVKAVNQGQVLPPMIRQSAALLKAACNECDFEPRFPRLLTEACLKLKDIDGAISAIQRYRAIQLPEIQNDQFAQVQLIDLYTGKAETLEDKLKYLNPLLGVKALPDPVKSHIAWVCSNLYAQKFDAKNAAALLAQSLQLNPLNPEALQSEYVAAKASGSAERTATALVSLLKSNPAQPLVMGTLADQLASVGQPDLAVTWYKRSFGLAQELGVGLDPGRYLNYAAALYAMDQPGSANEAANMLLASQPSNIGAATIGLLNARSASKSPGAGAPADVDQLQHAREAALAALTAQLGTLHASLHGVTGAAATQASTTQPADLIGDILSDAPKVRDLKNKPDATSQEIAFGNGYAAALADLIFYYTYFDPQPGNANKLLDALKALRPADDVELTRLEGFAFLADGKRDEAKVKFSAVADHDPLAQMGLLLMEPAGAATSAAAAKLVTDHPAGLLGAILLDGLHDKGGKPTSTPDSIAVATQAAAFPVRLLDLLDPAHTPEFYNLVAQPLHVSRGYGEPALVRVTIKDVGDYDLSVGTDAAIRPDLWFDVGVQAAANPFFAGVAYDHIAGPLVLKAHHMDQPGTDQVIRVDNGPLATFLAEHPTIAVGMDFAVFTNPIGRQAGVSPGPGGYRKQFASEMERRASPISTPKEVQDLVDPAMSGRIDQKVHTLELLADYVVVLRAKIAETQKALNPPPAPPISVPAPGADAGAADAAAMPPPSALPAAPPPDPKAAAAMMQHAQELIAQFTATIRQTLRDPSPTVRYCAQAKLAELADPATRQATAAMMVQGKDWEQRMLGLVLANELPRDQSKAIAEALKSDPVNYVSEFANATIEIANLPPTTRPAAAP